MNNRLLLKVKCRCCFSWTVLIKGFCEPTCARWREGLWHLDVPSTSVMSYKLMDTTSGKKAWWNKQDCWNLWGYWRLRVRFSVLNVWKIKKISLERSCWNKETVLHANPAKSCNFTIFGGNILLLRREYKPSVPLPLSKLIYSPLPGSWQIRVVT